MAALYSNPLTLAEGSSELGAVDANFEKLTKNLAAQIWNMRLKLKLTQSNLAARAGIPRSTLANLEAGGANPSLLNLSKICRALNVPFEELLATPRTPVKLIRRAQVPVTKRGQNSVTVRKLLPDPILGMAIDRLEFAPRARFNGVPHSSGTKEYFHCVQGRIAMTIAGETFELEAGDVIAFPGEASHAYANPHDAPALGLSVVVLAPEHT